MSLFGSLMGDLDDDPIFGNHLSMMRQMNNMMNSIFVDPFSIMSGGFDMERGGHRGGLIPFSMPMMPNINRLLSGPMDNLGNGHSFSSSTVVSMTSGPDGRPQVYKATSSTRTAPGGIKETQKTVTDTATGTKKMAIGHHIGERAHIIEKEQNIHTGDREERQDFINLEEDEAEDFNKEWESKTRNRSEIPRIISHSGRHHHHHRPNGGLLAITGGPRRRQRQTSPLVIPGRGIKALSSTSTRTPYSAPGHSHQRRNKNIKTVSGLPPSPANNNE